ncbi:CYTH and CHAD domain-containing protein [Flocculibacter collagenilyticus]|uniref:CYTH and CHAD domain-containing protein n=1 Tax=Flocculibacter collagenilyticus TaxID=2744479 RepID=UPI0018F47D7F|nr:CYTH domain-containing protein [Flocculibacter collagenilyticus]
METEIELKFLVAPTDQDVVSQIQSVSADVLSHTVNKLSNTYFDTPERLLRQWDIGLRTREHEDKIEQTIKTAGQVTGGLHQRPEYNVPLSSRWPELVLFPENIWPNEANIEMLQDNIEALFTTDFERTKWHLRMPSGTEVELVYDVGDIRCGSDSQPINEIEIELITGNVDDVFVLAEQLNELLSVRLGFLSKAARGYQLSEQWQTEPKKMMECVKLAPNDTVEQAFIKCIESGIHFIQHHEQSYSEEPSLLALRRLTDGVALVRHSVWLFAGMLDPDATAALRMELKRLLRSFLWVESARQLKNITSKKSSFRKRLADCQQLISVIEERKGRNPTPDEVNQFFYSTEYNHTLLQLTRWLVTRGWRAHLSEEQREYGNSPIQHKSPEMLTRAWQILCDLVTDKAELTTQDYQDYDARLKRHLLTGVCLGNLYEREDRNPFRAPWVDLSEGVDELKILCLLQQIYDDAINEQEQAIEEDLEVIVTQKPVTKTTTKWLDDRKESLLVALEQTKRSALNMEPYW